MYAVICSPKFWKDIENTIISKGEQVLFKAIDSDIDIVAEFERVNRLAIKHFVIDISVAGDEKKFIRAVRNYRITHEDKTQIIIIAPDCRPGNELIHTLVTMGIYDIINPIGDTSEEWNIPAALSNALDNPAGYKKAVKWYIDGEISNQDAAAAKDTVKERTVTVTKEKIVGTVVIAVAGTMHRIGTTHTVISIAQFLKSQNFKVAVMELHKTESFNYIKNSYEGVTDEGDCYFLDSLCFYPYKSSLAVLDVLQADYNYLILDMGVYSSCSLDEFKRAAARVIVSGVKDWELTDLELILRTGDTINKNRYYFTFADKHTFDIVKANMDQLKCFQAPYNPNPLSTSKDCANVFRELLKDVIPEVKQPNQSKGPGLAKGLFNKFLKERGDDVEA